MSKSPLWAKGFEEVQCAAKKAGAATSTLKLTSHHTGPWQFETRFTFLNSSREILAVATIKHSTRYMNQEYEGLVLRAAQGIANNLPDSKVWINGVILGN